MTARLAELMTEEEAAQRLRLCRRSARHTSMVSLIRLGRMWRPVTERLGWQVHSEPLAPVHTLAATARAGGE